MRMLIPLLNHGTESKSVWPTEHIWHDTEPTKHTSTDRRGAAAHIRRGIVLTATAGYCTHRERGIVLTAIAGYCTHRDGVLCSPPLQGIALTVKLREAEPGGLAETSAATGEHH